ncbi:MAG: signal peptidase II [Planctomycetaceae bacterium]|jgi:signal peptidase II
MNPVPRSRWVLFGAVVASLLWADLASKSWAFQSLGYEHRTSDWSWETNLLWGRFSITFQTSFNRGALFGLGQGWTSWFAGLSLVAVAGILYWLFVRQEARSAAVTVCMALIAAGALGNLYDRLGWHGCTDLAGRRIHAVRDFIDCTIPGLRWRARGLPELVAEYPWPIFNLADVFLVVGTTVLVLVGLWRDSAQPTTIPVLRVPDVGALPPLER